MTRIQSSRFEECDTLLSKLAAEDDIHISTFYEWINPKTGKGGGSFPFRTGVCTVRTAIDHMIKGVKDKKRKIINNHIFVLDNVVSFVSLLSMLSY